MTSSADFISALARVFDLARAHSPHHPAVRVAFAEAMGALNPGGAVVEVTPEGLWQDGRPLFRDRPLPELARALQRVGVERLEIEGSAAPEDVDEFLLRLRRGQEAAGALRELASDRVRVDFRRGVPARAGDPGEVRLGPGVTTSDNDDRLARSIASLFRESGQPERDPGPVPAVALPDTFEDAVAAYASDPHPDLASIVEARAERLDPEEDLGRVVAAIESLILASDGSTGDPRLALARALARPEVYERLAGRLAAARDPDRRTEAIRVAVSLGSPMAGAVGTALSNAQDRGARRSFMDAFVAFGPAGLEAVESMIRDSRWFVVRNGVRLLPDVGGRRAVGHLGTALAHPDGRVRREAITGLTRIGGEEASGLVMAVLDDEEADVRSAAAKALGVMGGRQAGPALVHRLDAEPNGDVQIEVVRAVGRTRWAEAVPLLERRAQASFFSRPPAELRIASLRALWSVGTPEARTVVMHALDDRDPAVRGAVRALLGAH